jgi:hypothetical protein
MDARDAIRKAGQILDEERVEPTVRYESAAADRVIAAMAALSGPLRERGQHPRTVQEHPEGFQFKSTNFELLCAILDQIPEQGKTALFASLASRIKDPRSFCHEPGPVLGAGTWRRCLSELPLVAEFLVRRGDKQMFTSVLGEAAASPSLTLLLLQLEEMIALNFTLFTEEEYLQLPPAIVAIRKTISN